MPGDGQCSETKLCKNGVGRAASVGWTDRDSPQRRGHLSCAHTWGEHSRQGELQVQSLEKLGEQKVLGVSRKHLRGY